MLELYGASKEFDKLLNEAKEINAANKAHIFSYEMRDPDRQTTRSQWKEMRRFLRNCRDIVETKLKPQLDRCMTELLCFGSTVVKVD